jgi:hypothetical protein
MQHILEARATAFLRRLCNTPSSSTATPAEPLMRPSNWENSHAR